MSEPPTEDNDGDREGLSHTSSAANLDGMSKNKEVDAMKGEEKTGQSESSQYPGPFIPTCISPYQANTSAFVL